MKAKYGLRALVALTRDYGRGPVLIADLAASESIPRKFLELILLDLKRKGILQSKKGKGGGYNLSRPPSLISARRSRFALLMDRSPCCRVSVRRPIGVVKSVWMSGLVAFVMS